MTSGPWQDSLRAQVRDWRSGVEALRASAAVSSDLELASLLEGLLPLLGDLERACERAREAGVVALVGPTGAGKSSLFNALCGEDVSTVSKQRPTTSSLVVVESRPGLARELLGRRLQGLSAPRPLRQFEGETPLLLVDGPDHNTGRAAHRETSRLLAEEADLLVVVVHAQGIIELAQLQFLAPFLGRRRVLGVLGHADEVSAEARTELLSQLAEVLGESLGQAPLDVIALDLREASIVEDPQAWDDVRRHLLQHVQGEALERLLEGNAEGALRRLQEGAQSLQKGLRSHGHERVAALEAGLDTWKEALVTRHLESVQRDPEAWHEATRRSISQGMGGLARLLLGASWTQLGAYLGGAFLLRRSPLAGAGVLAAGTALSATRGTSSVEELAEEELASIARLIQELLSGSQAPATSNEQELETWRERSRRAGRAGIESWRAAELGGGSWRGLQRGLLEVPLALLALRAIVMAALGLVGQGGFGVDGLIDSLLLGIAWMGLWRLLMGMVATRVARGALEGLARRLRQSVNLVAEEVLESEREELAAVVQIASSLGHSAAGGRL